MGRSQSYLLKLCLCQEKFCIERANELNGSDIGSGSLVFANNVVSSFYLDVKGVYMCLPQFWLLGKELLECLHSRVFEFQREVLRVHCKLMLDC